MHMVSWKTITKTNREEGFGMQHTITKNDTLLFILVWRIYNNPTSLLAIVLTSKYKINRHKLLNPASRTWEKSP